MSKFVKNLVARHLSERLDGVDELLLVNVVGLDVNVSNALRNELRSKDMNLMVVKNSLARRATEGTVLGPAFEGADGAMAVVWGGSDIVALAKEVTRLADVKEYAPFAPRGGVTGGESLTADEVAAVSKWPSREEQLSMLVGQILGPGARLAGQLAGAGGALASQIQQIADGEAGAAEAGEEAAG